MCIPPSVSLTTLAFPCLAAATPTSRTLPASQCATGPVQCCKCVQDITGTDMARLFGMVNVVAQDVTTVPVGITCSPISVIGVGNDSW
ncbi:hypothetical protein BDQ17DRAFT_297735 [Cyathus striatus]|nr:hypothetical protein BDQ17DRAFT_297735 [Cyathus striatus]